jgi:hypothetical protein
MQTRKIHSERYLITLACFAVLVASVVAYMYFLSLSVVHVVMRKDLNRETVQLRSEIATLESAYIEASHRISQKVATADSFTAVKDKIFIHSGAESSLVLRTANE